MGQMGTLAVVPAWDRGPQVNVAPELTQPPFHVP